MPSLSPPPCIQMHQSASDVEPGLRFDAWREAAHRWVDFMPSPDVRLDADLHILHSGACTFGATRSSAYEMRTGPRHLAHEEDMVVLALVQAGEMRLNAAPGEHQHMRPGFLGLYAPQQEGHYRWSQGARQAYLALPRQVVRTVLAEEPGNLLISPERCALAPALVSQLDHLALLARQPDRVDAAEYAGLLESTRALALLMLRNLGRQGARADQPDRDERLGENLHAGRHAAALRFMAQEAHRHDLDVAAIAHAVGCSRTRLYEAFAARKTTVMDALREIRLQRARELIEQSPRLHVGALSWRCGFVDQSGFSKLFRTRFGLLPTEWHRRVWANPSAGA